MNKIKGHLTQEDSGIMDLLSNIAGFTLKNCLMYDSSVINERKLFRLMDIILKLSRETDLKTFLIQSKIYLSQLISADQTQVFLYDSIHEVLITIPERDAQKPILCPDIIGIIGFVLANRKIYETNDPKRDQHYNPKLDLNTDLPLLTVPILDEELTVLGIFQVTNLRTQAEKHLGKAKWLNYDLISLYARFLANCFRMILTKSQKELSEILLK